MLELDPVWLDRLIEHALQEDIGGGDWTTDLLVPDGLPATATILAEESGVLCGVKVAQRVFARLDAGCQFPLRMVEGAPLQDGEPVLVIEGEARALLKGERTALNFLQRLSGIATLTARFVQQVQGTKARIVDTRKTTPGLRALEKYAVRIGGGFNHRFGLFDGLLIKDNHLALVGGDVQEAVRRVRAGAPHTLRIEVECSTLQQVQSALEAGVDAILLDNMPLEILKQAVEMARGKVQWIEASGGVHLETVRAIAEAGVDLISVGALTHSAPILPMHMEIEIG